MPTSKARGPLVELVMKLRNTEEEEEEKEKLPEIHTSNMTLDLVRKEKMKILHHFIFTLKRWFL